MSTPLRVALREPLTVGSLFTGIGGIDLGLERTGGFTTVWQCELDPYCNAVLEKHWPDVTRYGDIRSIDGTAERVDVIAGGFPCQPVSLAGKRKGQEDARWLWPEFSRVVGLLRPRFVLVENVPGLASKGLKDVVTDLASLGYDAEWDVVSAASVGAPHLRERLFVVAYPRSAGRWEDARGAYEDEGEHARRPEEEDHVSDGDGEGDRAGQVQGTVAHSSAPGLPNGGGSSLGQPEEEPEPDRRGRVYAGVQNVSGRESDPRWWTVEPDVGRVAHGVPSRVHRLRSLGNAVVPQVAEFVGNLILESL